MPDIVSPVGVHYVGFLDVSGWQHAYAGNGRLQPGAKPPNYRQAADRGIVAVMARAGNGTTLDESFDLTIGAAKAAGLKTGAYYYAQPRRLSPRIAAETLVGWTNRYSLDMPLVLDLEEYHGGALPPAELGAWLRRWFAEVEQLTGRPGLLYAGAAFANPTTIGDPAGNIATIDTIQPRYPRGSTAPPSNLDYWAAWIPWHSPPRTTPTLGTWEAWQFSSSAVWADFGAPPDTAKATVDVNIVDVETWKRWLGHSPTPPPPPAVIPPIVAPPAVIPPAYTGDLMPLRIARPATRLVDTRTTGDPLEAGEERLVHVPAPGATGAVVTITALSPAAAGYLVVYGPGDRPGTSTVNYQRGTPAISNTTVVELDAGEQFTVWTSARVDLIVDLVAVLGE